VRGSKSWSTRTLTLALVIALHAAIITVAVMGPPFKKLNPPATDFFSTLLFVPAPVAQTNSTESRRPILVNVRPFSAPLELPNPEAVESTSDAPADSPNWTEEAQREGTAITEQPKRRTFGQTPHAVEGETPQKTVPAHHAGEQYQDSFGDSILWVNDHCYLLSESAPLGVPQNSIPTRTVCVGDLGEPRGDLFKSLSAYKRYHPQ
jgi:hypothetical protein